jgi:hypothetical protein
VAAHSAKLQAALTKRGARQAAHLQQLRARHVAKGTQAKLAAGVAAAATMTGSNTRTPAPKGLPS